MHCQWKGVFESTQEIIQRKCKSLIFPNEAFAKPDVNNAGEMLLVDKQERGTCCSLSGNTDTSKTIVHLSDWLASSKHATETVLRHLAYSDGFSNLKFKVKVKTCANCFNKKLITLDFRSILLWYLLKYTHWAPAVMFWPKSLNYNFSSI